MGKKSRIYDLILDTQVGKTLDLMENIIANIVMIQI